MMSTSDVRIAQDSRQKGPAWWQWSAWIEGEPSTLDRIDEVVWHLHPTFQQPNVPSRDRAEKFRLDTYGWGEFTLRATVRFRDRSTVALEHDVVLAVTAEQPRPARKSRSRSLGVPKGAVSPATPTGRVYLSHSLSDADVARQLESSLRDHGIEVQVPGQGFELGESIAKSVKRLIDQSDVMVALHSSAASEFVDYEADYATAQGKLVLNVQVGPAGPSSTVAGERQALLLDREDASRGVAEISDQILRSLQGGELSSRGKR